MVSKVEAMEYAKTVGFKYIETSAMKDIGVKNAFDLVFEAAILAKHYQKLADQELNNPDKFNVPNQRARIQSLINKSEPQEWPSRERGVSFSIKRDVILRKKSLCTWLSGK